MRRPQPLPLVSRPASRPRVSTWAAAYVPRWLQRPPFTTLVDAQLWVVTLVTRPRTFRRMLAVHHRLRAVSGLTCGTHRYGGIGYRIGGTEVAHLHGDGLLDAYLGAGRARRVRAAGLAAAHHGDGGAGWVTLDLGAASAADVWRVLAAA